MAVNPSCLLVQQQSLALDFYGSSSGGGDRSRMRCQHTRVICQRVLFDSFMPKETPQSPGKEGSPLISFLFLAGALLLRENRPAYCSWSHNVKKRSLELTIRMR